MALLTNEMIREIQAVADAYTARERERLNSKGSSMTDSEMMARALHRADVIFLGYGAGMTDADFDQWFDDSASATLSGPGFRRYWFALAEAALAARQRDEQ